MSRKAVIGLWGCALSLFMGSAPPVAAREPVAVVRIAERGVVPENLTSMRDGTILIGSYGKGTIYRAAPGADRAEPWIAAGTQGMTRSMGLWADERRGRLWVCAPGPRKTDSRPAGTSFVRTFDLRTGAVRTAYPMAEGGSCNDLTMAADGTVYASDMAGRIFRLRRGERAFAVWATDPALAGADGLALLADGDLYVNSYRSGGMMRVPVAKGGSAGAVRRLTLDRALENPDGMRRVGPDRLLVAEGVGRLTELTVRGERVSVRTVRDGIADSPTGVTLVGGVAYVTQARWDALQSPEADRGVFTATAIPYSPVHR